MIHIFHTDEENGVIPIRLLEYARFLNDALPQLTDHEVNVILTDDETISKLHGDFMGDESVTDVISFSLGKEDNLVDIEDDIEDTWGEVYINVEQATRQSGEMGHGLNKELAVLMTHGLMHLIGWEDESEEQRCEMISTGDGYITRFESQHGVFGS